MTGLSRSKWTVCLGVSLLAVVAVIGLWIGLRRDLDASAPGAAGSVDSGGPVPVSPHHSWKQAVAQAGPAGAANTAPNAVSIPAPPSGPSRTWRWPGATWERVATRGTPGGGEERRYRVRAPGERYPELVAREIWNRGTDGAWVFAREEVMIADHILVRTRPGVAPGEVARIAAAHGCTVREQMFAPGHFLVSFAEPGWEPLQRAVADFQAEVAHIAGAEPDYLRFASVIPNDTHFGLQWGPHNTGQSGGTVDIDFDGPEAWDITSGGDDVVVGVIDSGTQFTHPDLAANIWANPGEIAGNNLDDDNNGLVDDMHGFDFYAFDNDPSDEHGHGTHVAGTVAAVGNNGTGVAGASWGARIMVLRFLGPNGSGPNSAAINCIYYARSRLLAGEPVRITNNSWGGSGYSSALLSAINDAGAAGQLFVAAAGNDGANLDTNPDYPAAYTTPHLLCVANITRTGARASTSNYGLNSVDIGAAGSSILSTYPGSQYAYLSGTSMASPQVAGAAAVLFDLAPNASVADVKGWIMDGGVPLASLAGKTVTGDMLNLFNAIDEAGLRVAASTPEEDEVVSAPPTQFTIRVTGDLDAGTVDAADLEVNGTGADGVTQISSKELQFDFAVSPVISEGLQTMSVAAGAFRRIDNEPVVAWIADFRYDAVLLAVTSTVPADGGVVPLPFTQLDPELERSHRSQHRGHHRHPAFAGRGDRRHRQRCRPVTLHPRRHQHRGTADVRAAGGGRHRCLRQRLRRLCGQLRHRPRDPGRGGRLGRGAALWRPGAPPLTRGLFPRGGGNRRFPHLPAGGAGVQRCRRRAAGDPSHADPP